MLMKQQMRNLIHIKTNELKKYMEIKSINTLSITECCEQLNIRRDDLPKALQDIIVLSERERLLIAQLQSLLDDDKSAIESCRTIEQYEGYLSTWVDGLYHDYARTKITQLKAEARKQRFKYYFGILLLVFFAITLLNIAIETIGLSNDMDIYISDEYKCYGAVFVDDIFGNKYPLIRYSQYEEDNYGWLGLATTTIYNPNLELSESSMITLGNSIITKRKIVGLMYSIVLMLLSFLIYKKLIQKKLKKI